MRTSVKVTLASLALIGIAGAIAACSDARATETAKDPDLSHDLELASAATLALAGRGVDSANLASLETRPASAPEASNVVKRGAGTKAVRSKAPTVRATPVAEPAAAEGEGESFAKEAAASESDPVAILPVPAPTPAVASAPAGDYGSGGGIFGGGDGRTGSGGRGVVIRGGGVDGDNCELHRRPRGARGPIYVPAPVVPTSSQPTVNRAPTRGGISIGSRNPGTVSRRPETVSATPRERTDPRRARRGL
jgi:hypothetical protein